MVQSLPVDHSARKLGRMPARHDERTLLLANYLDLNALPPIPAKRDWAQKASPAWGMMKNDVLGDCTIAAAGHLVQTWTANNGQEVTIPDAHIVAAYTAVTGYNPNNPASDRGAVEIDVLNFLRRQGIAGHKIGAYAGLEPGNHAHVKAAIDQALRHIDDYLENLNSVGSLAALHPGTAQREACHRHFSRGASVGAGDAPSLCIGLAG